ALQEHRKHDAFWTENNARWLEMLSDFCAMEFHHTHTLSCTHTHTYSCTHTHIHTHTLMRTHAHTHAHTRTPTHAHPRAHTHTHVRRGEDSGLVLSAAVSYFTPDVRVCVRVCVCACVVCVFVSTGMQWG